MIAFLKRRWFLLSCAVLMLGCSFFDVTKDTSLQLMNATFGELTVLDRRIGLNEGAFCFYVSDFSGMAGRGDTDVQLVTEFHRPLFGGTVGGLRSRKDVSIPLWLPLAVVVGWIVFRELRWRERRAKAAQAAQ